MRSLNFIKDIDKHIEITEQEAWKMLSEHKTVYIKTKRGLYIFSENINTKTIKISVSAISHIKDLGETFINKIVEVKKIKWYK